MTRRTCGLWQTHAGFVAVVLDDGRPRKPILVCGTPPAIEHFCRWLADIRSDLTAPSDLPVRPLVDECAQRAGVRYRIVPGALVASLCLATGVPPRSAPKGAAIVARVGHLPYFRDALRTPEPIQPRLF